MAESEAPQNIVINMPEPETRTERLLYIGVIMGVAAFLVVGLAIAWILFLALGIVFPAEAQLVLFGALNFLFGGAFAAKK